MEDKEIDAVNILNPIINERNKLPLQGVVSNTKKINFYKCNKLLRYSVTPNA
jgi:hypothetical protein